MFVYCLIPHSTASIKSDEKYSHLTFCHATLVLVTGKAFKKLLSLHLKCRPSYDIAVPTFI